MPESSPSSPTGYLKPATSTEEDISSTPTAIGEGLSKPLHTYKPLELQYLERKIPMDCLLDEVNRRTLMTSKKHNLLKKLDYSALAGLSIPEEAKDEVIVLQLLRSAEFLKVGGRADQLGIK